MSDPFRQEEAPLFHLALRLEGQHCLVVGGGRVGARKAVELVSCGAKVTVVAPEISAVIEELGVKIERRAYEPADLDGCRLAVAATGLPAVDRQVYEDARSRGVLVNAADDPEACEFFFPAIARFGPVSIAVSTGGLSPYMAGWVKRQVGEALSEEVGELVLLVGRCRRAIRAAGFASSAADWDRLVEEMLWPLLQEGRRDEATDVADLWLGGELERLSQN